MPRDIRELSPEQLDRLRRTIEATIEDWLQDYGLPPDKPHRQLVNRVVGAILAMHQSDFLVVQPLDGE